jgi:hypothetical protein
LNARVDADSVRAAMTNPMTTLPHELPRLDGPDGPLARSGPARSVPFSLGGRRAAAWGSELRGLEEVRSGGWTLLSGLRSELGPASGVVVGPSSIRREAVGAGGSVLETVLVPPDLPGAVVQWARPRGSSDELLLRVEWSMGWAGAELHAHERVEGGVSITVKSLAGAEPPMALALLQPRPSRLDVRTEPGGLRISAEVRSPADAPATLLLVGAPSAMEATRALRSLTGLRAQERRAEHVATEARAEQLSTDSAGPLDDALEWVKARLRTAVPAGSGHRPRSGDDCGADESDDAWLALGALAAGDPEPAALLLARGPASTLEWLAAARFAAWTGRGAALLAHRGATEALGRRLSESTGGDPVAAVAVREIADAWDSVDRTFAAKLRTAGAVAGERSGRQLPMAGRGESSAGEARARARLHALFDESPTWYQEPDTPAGGVERALRAWALARAGDAELAWAALLAHAESGFEQGAGLWRRRAGAPAACADHAPSAALLPAGLLFGLLGAAADAPVGRLRLAPRVPSSLHQLGVTGIRIGDARVRLEYRRSGSEHRFCVTQETGRIPVMLIFEPEVAGADLVEAWVDGAAAELDRSVRAGRSRVRVQLPLDAPRTLTLGGRGGVG